MDILAVSVEGLSGERNNSGASLLKLSLTETKKTIYVGLSAIVSIHKTQASELLCSAEGSKHSG